MIDSAGFSIIRNLFYPQTSAVSPYTGPLLRSGCSRDKLTRSRDFPVRTYNKNRFGICQIWYNVELVFRVGSFRARCRRKIKCIIRYALSIKPDWDMVCLQAFGGWITAPSIENCDLMEWTQSKAHESLHIVLSRIIILNVESPF